MSLRSSIWKCVCVCFHVNFEWSFTPSYLIHWFMSPKNRINVSHLGKRKIIFNRALVGDMLVSRRVYIYIYTHWSIQAFMPWAVSRLKQSCAPSVQCRKLLWQPPNPAEILVETVVQGQPSSVGKHEKLFICHPIIQSCISQFLPEFHPQI